MLLDWLRVEYAIEKPSNKLFAMAELYSDTWVGEAHPGQEIGADRLPRSTL
jgi:hypothetical protein